MPLAEELEAYEIEILDGTAVKRVLSVNTTSAVYTAAQQTADWGAPLSPGDEGIGVTVLSAGLHRLGYGVTARTTYDENKAAQRPSLRPSGA